MLIAVDFVSRRTFEELEAAPDMVAISINDPGDPAPKNLSQFSRSLSLFFLDIEPEPGEVLRDKDAAFNAYCAEAIRTFVQQLHTTDGHYRLVVHCRMGASRSAAVALLAKALTGCHFPRERDAHDANRYVVSLAADHWGIPVYIPAKPMTEDYLYLPSSLQV